MNSFTLSKEELIRTRIKKIAINGKISCPALRRLAEELKVSYKEVGKMANQLKIKIKNCDLGCF
jgi:LAO/AO transport system kinase